MLCHNRHHLYNKMEPLIFVDEEARQDRTYTRPAHAVTDVIQPWSALGRDLGKTQQLWRKDISGRIKPERKKTVDERIEEMYRKYSKQGPQTRREPTRGASRQIYRQKLKQFQLAQQFRQLGQRRQQSCLQGEQEQLSFEVATKKMSSTICANDYGIDVSPLKAKQDATCADKFQRMMKLRDRIRRKNNLTVTKQRQKYLSEYTSIHHPMQREPSPPRQEKEKPRLKSQSKSRVQQTSPRIDPKIHRIDQKTVDYLLRKVQRRFISHNSYANALQLNSAAHTVRF